MGGLLCGWVGGLVSGHVWVGELVNGRVGELVSGWWVGGVGWLVAGFSWL